MPFSQIDGKLKMTAYVLNSDAGTHGKISNSR
jgi:hypothetical protein